MTQGKIKPKTRRTERIGLVLLEPLKASGGKYYFTLKDDVVHSYRLLTGDLLKIGLIESRKDRDDVEEEPEQGQEL